MHLTCHAEVWLERLKTRLLNLLSVKSGCALSGFPDGVCGKAEKNLGGGMFTTAIGRKQKIIDSMP